MSEDFSGHDRHQTPELQLPPTKFKYRIKQADNTGRALDYLGDLEYESLWNDRQGIIKWSMVIPGKGISQKATLRLDVPSLEPVSVHVITDGPDKNLSVEANYSCSLNLHHFRPLALDLAKVIAIKICLAPKDFWGNPVLKGAETHSFLIPRRPNFIDSFGILETVRQMVVCGESARSAPLFDVNSRLYFNCTVSKSGKENIQTEISEYECLRYEMISVQPDSGISVTENFYFRSTPPFCLIRHERPTQLLEIVDLGQQA